MQGFIGRGPSPALVISLIALFTALGGTGYAALRIDGRSIKNRTVAGKKIKKDSLGRAEIRESKLGRVPSARRANSAARADSAGRADNAVRADDAASLGGAPSTSFASKGLPPLTTPELQNGWQASPDSAPPGYWVDQGGVVHLQGGIQGGTPNIVFTLPAGIAPKTIHSFVIACGGVGQLGRVDVYSGGVQIGNAGTSDCSGVGSLDGISYRPD